MQKENTNLAIVPDKNAHAPLKEAKGPAQEHMACVPEKALALLKEGNRRHASDNRMNPVQVFSSPLEGQKPFATILCCSDSRVPPEIVFDQGPGKLFIVRVAGNILTPELLASIEYASLFSTSRLIVVLGHQGCGAIISAIRYAQTQEKPDSPHLEALLRHILPVVEKTGKKTDLSGQSLAEASAMENVRHVVARIQKLSQGLKQLTEKGDLKIMGAWYSLETCKVDFL